MEIKKKVLLEKINNLLPKATKEQKNDLGYLKLLAEESKEEILNIPSKDLLILIKIR
jgi:hypothetical protein